MFSLLCSRVVACNIKNRMVLSIVITEEHVFECGRVII